MIKIVLVELSVNDKFNVNQKQNPKEVKKPTKNIKK
jgi:hypothetical protein